MFQKTIGIWLTCFLLALAMLVAKDNPEKEKNAIIQVIESAYMNGICNEGDVEAIKAGFHPEFHLMGISKGKFWKLPIDQWAKRVEADKSAGKYPPKEKVSFQYPLIDITGHAAMVKVKFLKGGKHIYSDYLQLYKFKEGWKIMNKIYYAHQPPPPPKK